MFLYDLLVVISVMFSYFLVVLCLCVVLCV